LIEFLAIPIDNSSFVTGVADPIFKPFPSPNGKSYKELARFEKLKLQKYSVPYYLLTLLYCNLHSDSK
jgi:hypothetical protein